MQAQPSCQLEEDESGVSMTYNIHNRWGSHQANNVRGSLAQAVWPWFAEFADDRVRRAIANLDDSEQREHSLEFLGLELTNA
ncbi:MAG: hypothetical protein Q4A71_02945 [Actinomycetaceae bacterium]|nr:hypothetical protein [Actinomycetaceae bacterium]